MADTLVLHVSKITDTSLLRIYVGKRIILFSNKLLVENYHFYPTGLHVPTGGGKASPDFGAFCCKYHSYTRGSFFLPYILRQQDNVMISKTLPILN